MPAITLWTRPRTTAAACAAGAPFAIGVRGAVREVPGGAHHLEGLGVTVGGAVSVRAGVDTRGAATTRITGATARSRCHNYMRVEGCGGASSGLALSTGKGNR
jgi:hypothetical protein